MLNMYSPIQEVLFRLLNGDRNRMKLLPDTNGMTGLFRDLLEIGLDFFELLRIFCANDSPPHLDSDEFSFSFPPPDEICRLNEKSIRKVISRWTGSKYHSAPIDSVVREVHSHIAGGHVGSYVYHSNHNPVNKKAADDIYVLFVQPDSSTFIDLNRRKSYLFLGGTV